MSSDVLREQISYYRSRASEYDEWFYRIGRFDHGPELNELWFEEVRTLEREVRLLGPFDRALELACGTGIWTKELIQVAGDITAIDASAEVLEINRNKVGDTSVRYMQTDLFEWQPDGEYDLVFFSFWLSHVPPENLDEFLGKVQRAVRPGGTIFMMDSQRDPTSTAVDHAPYDKAGVYHRRKLNDGREFTVVKVFYEPEALEGRLAAHGLDVRVKSTGRYFWYAAGIKRPQ